MGKIFTDKSKLLSISIISVILLIIISIIINGFLGSEPSNSLPIRLDDGDQNIYWNSYDKKEINLAELSENLVIKKSGTYILSGESSFGIEIDVGDKAGVLRLILNNASISTDTTPAVFVRSADKVIIETSKDSENYLRSNVSDNTLATIYSLGDLSFYGEGKLLVEGVETKGVISKDDLNIRSGNYIIHAGSDAIVGKNSVKITGGTIQIASNQDGIKSNNQNESDRGYVMINDGEINISARDDAIHAETYLIVNGGKIDISECYEGLEGEKVIINGGEISLVSLDDGINAASKIDNFGFSNYKNMNSDAEILINGGKIFVDAAGDGIDSNGSLTISGGDVVINGPKNSKNGALDVGDMDEIILDGGSLVASGAIGMERAPSSKSKVNSLSIYFENPVKAGEEIKIKDNSGETVLSYRSNKEFSHIVIGNDKIISGKAYKVFVQQNEIFSFSVDNAVTTLGKTYAPPRRP